MRKQTTVFQGLVVASVMAGGGTALGQEQPAAATFPPDASATPSAPASPAAASEPAARAVAQEAAARGVVTFIARPGVAFYQTPLGGGEPSRICLAPCEARLAGEHRFALSLDGSAPVEAKETVRLSGNAVAEGEYRSRDSTRAAGWIILGIGVPGGIAAIATGAGIASSGGTDDRLIGGATALGGAVGFGVSLIMGLALGLTGDVAHVHVRPAAP